MAGLSKDETFHKLNSIENNSKYLAHAISSFPSSQNYLGKQQTIRRFYLFLQTYFLLLFAQFGVVVSFQRHWAALAVLTALAIFILFIFSFAKKGIIKAMLLMLAIPLLNTIQMVIEHASVVSTHPDVLFNKTEILMLYFSSLFFVYSLFSVIYGLKLFREITEGERLVGRFRWNQEIQKPEFTELTSGALAPLAPLN